MTNRIRYLSFLIVLFSLLIFLMLRGGGGESDSNDRVSFALQDTAKVDKLMIGDQLIERQPGGSWLLNAQTKVDEQMLYSLLSLLQKIEIKQPVPEEQQEKIISHFATNGLDIKLFYEGKLKDEYLIAGEEDQTYAMRTADARPYVIYVPGYFVRIYSLFDIDADTWRDKTLFRLNWRTLKDFQIVYHQRPEKNLRIYFDEEFYAIEGVEQLDSAKLYYYVSDVGRFKAEAYLDNPDLLDSLQENTTPFCTIRLKAIDLPEEQVLQIYANEPNLYGLLLPDEQLVRLSPRSLGSFLATPQDFTRKE